MKLGLNLGASLLTESNFRFARQAGAEAIVAHLVDYDRIFPASDAFDWRYASTPRPLWSVELLDSLRAAVERAGLELAAIENLEPCFWSDILLDGPRREAQLEDVKILVRRIGEAGIPALGYYFSLAGVWGQRWHAPAARGEAVTAAFDATILDDAPMRRREVWAMETPVGDPDTVLGPVPPEQVWARLEGFLAEIVPVAEEAGVRLAAHPDDPPVVELRQTARILARPAGLERLLATVPSPANGLDFCVGTMAEAIGDEVYDVVGRFARAGAVVYAHVRNVRGRVPRYVETFLDDGDLDIQRVLGILAGSSFEGVVVPDHTPALSCAAPWHAGTAYALGYLRCALDAVCG